jgi:hypothetical protein
MSVISELDQTLRAMDFVQLLLAFAFLTGYALALGELFGALGRRRAALAALVAACGFTAMTNPWVHGALLVVFAIAGVGLFIAIVWAFGYAFGMARDTPAQAPSFALEPVVQPQPRPMPSAASPVRRESPNSA